MIIDLELALMLVGGIALFMLTAILVQLSFLRKKNQPLLQTLDDLISAQCQQIIQSVLKEQMVQQQRMSESLIKFSQQNNEMQQLSLHHLQTTLRDNFSELDKQIHSILQRSTTQLSEQFDKLNQATTHNLLKISEAVEIRLNKGFEKTNETFTNIVQRLAIIDDAQKKITDLSQNVVGLQNLLSDKRSRGAFGEVQLNVLIQNVLPSHCYQLQYTLSNSSRVDCLLLLPEPTGKLAIDAKFPLENYQKYLDITNDETVRTAAKHQFKIDIKKHIQDISQKYIIPGETSDGAIMFIPAEAIFAEIHSHHADLVEYAWQMRVWLASPSTMMAILTTASSVLKDSATRQQVHVIQEHLRLLAQDFTRFDKRMTNLSQHLRQANDDAEQVHISSQKITKRFQQIEKVELEPLTMNPEHSLMLEEKE
ncbi:MAG: DNA recombination protein RmuC [Candidatus Berkiella sp.]